MPCERAGKVVAKEQLIRTAWPDTFVSDDVLTRCISDLRRAFGDDAKEPRFIQTIPKSGYRLIADVSVNAEHEHAAPTPHRNHRRVYIAVVLLTAVAVGLWWSVSNRGGNGLPARQPLLAQLTANPPGLPVNSGRISPDGKYLAYADDTGIQVRVIDTGETQRLADTRDMDVYAWNRDGTRIRAAACDDAKCVGWDLSLIGGGRVRSGAIWPGPMR